MTAKLTKCLHSLTSLMVLVGLQNIANAEWRTQTLNVNGQTFTLSTDVANPQRLSISNGTRTITTRILVDTPTGEWGIGHFAYHLIQLMDTSRIQNSIARREIENYKRSGSSVVDQALLSLQTQSQTLNFDSASTPANAIRNALLATMLSPLEVQVSCVKDQIKFTYAVQPLSAQSGCRVSGQLQNFRTGENREIFNVPVQREVDNCIERLVVQRDRKLAEGYTCQVDSQNF